MSGWLLMISVSTLRISAESSTHQHRDLRRCSCALRTARSPPPAAGASLRSGVVALALHERVVGRAAQLLDQHLAAARARSTPCAGSTSQQVLRERPGCARSSGSSSTKSALRSPTLSVVMKPLSTAPPPKTLASRRSRRAPRLQQLVDQHLHRVGAVARRRGLAARAGSPSSGSMKWFMPPTPASRSRRQAATHEPSTVVSTHVGRR